MHGVFKEKLSAVGMAFSVTWKMLTAPYTFASTIGEDSREAGRAATYFFQAVVILYGAVKLMGRDVIDRHYSSIVSLPWGDELLALYLFSTAALYSLLIYLAVRLHHLMFAFTYSTHHRDWAPKLYGCIAIILYGTGFIGFVLVGVEGAALAVHQLTNVKITSLLTPYGKYVLGAMTIYLTFILIPSLGAGKYLDKGFWIFGITFYPVVRLPVELFQAVKDWALTIGPL